MALNGWPWVPPVTGPVTFGRATSAPGASASGPSPAGGSSPASPPDDPPDEQAATAATTPITANPHSGPAATPLLRRRFT